MMHMTSLGIFELDRAKIKKMYPASFLAEKYICLFVMSNQLQIHLFMKWNEKFDGPILKKQKFPAQLEQVFFRFDTSLLWHTYMHFFNVVMCNPIQIQKHTLAVKKLLRNLQVVIFCWTFRKMASSQENSDCQSSQPSRAKRIHFRSETYACSSDRTTIEEMADHVISR